jgi:class 3 adenylate cyclase
MDDVRAVMDAVGSKQAVLLGSSEGGPMSILFCATYPERVAGLVLYGSMARTSWAPDYPCGRTPEQQAAILRDMEEKWGQGHSVDRFAPTLASNPEYRKWRGRVDRSGATPAAAAALMRLTYQIDVRQILGSIKVPTLVIHKTDDPAVRVDHGRYLASHIPNAKYVELPGCDHPPWVDSADGIASAIQAFTRSLPDVQQHDRVLTTLLFTQIMTGVRGARFENRALGELIAQHRLLVGKQVEQLRGRRLEAVEDGFLAAFDGPARAVRCGLAIVDACKQHGLQMRAGVHIGECDFLDDKLGGVAVRIAMSVTASAAPSEVLVSSTVRDVVAGSELDFEPREAHVFEGIPGTWLLLAAVQGP